MSGSWIAHVLAVLFVLTNSASAVEKVKWVNDWLPGGDKAVVYVGVHAGLFAAEGLDVEILSGRGSADAITKVASGVGELTAAGIAALMQAKAQGTVPVRAILSIYTKQPDAIFTSEGAGIKSLKEMEGKAIATGTFSSSNVIWPLVLQQNSVDPARVELVKVDPPALAPMLASGRVAGIVSWMPNVPLFDKALSATGKQLKILPWFDYGFQGYAFSLMASDRMISERPEVLRKFMRAYRKATEAAIANPRLAAESVRAQVPELDLAVAEAQWKASIPLMVNEVSKKDGMGAFEPALLKETWSWVSKSLNISMDKLDSEQVVDRSFN